MDCQQQFFLLATIGELSPNSTLYLKLNLDWLGVCRTVHWTLMSIEEQVAGVCRVICLE